MRVKMVLSIDPTTGAETPVATFTLLDDGKVEAEWESETYRDEVEENGIGGLRGRRLRPEDGRPFFDQLEAAYAASTFVSVRRSEG